MADTRPALVTAATCSVSKVTTEAPVESNGSCKTTLDHDQSPNKHNKSPPKGNSGHLINGSVNGKLVNSDSSSGCEEDSHDHTTGHTHHHRRSNNSNSNTNSNSNKCDQSKQSFLDAAADGSIGDEDEAVDIEECDSSSSTSVCDLIEGTPDSLCKLLYTTSNSVVITSDQLFKKVVSSSAKENSKAKLTKFSTSSNLPNGHNHNNSSHSHSHLNGKKHHHHHHPAVTVASISSTSLQVRRGSEPVLNRTLSPESLLFATGTGIDSLNNKRWSTAVAVDSKRFGSQHRKLLSSDQYLDCEENEDSNRKCLDQTRNQINSSHHSERKVHSNRERDSSPSSCSSSSGTSGSDTCTHEYQSNHQKRAIEKASYSHSRSSQMIQQSKQQQPQQQQQQPQPQQQQQQQSSGSVVHAVVDAAVSCYLSPNDQARVVTFSVKSEPGPLGIHVVPYSDSIRDGQSNGMMIEMIEPKGRIDQDGRFNVGDWIIEVNGKSLLGIDFDAAQEIFKQALKVSAEINLKVIKSTTCTSMSLAQQSSNLQSEVAGPVGNPSSTTTPTPSSRSLQSSNSNNISSSSPSPSSCIPCPVPSSVVASSHAYVKSTTVAPVAACTTSTATIKSLGSTTTNVNSNNNSNSNNSNTSKCSSSSINININNNNNQKNHHHKPPPPNVLPKPPLSKVMAAEAAAAAAVAAATNSVASSQNASQTTASSSSSCMIEPALPSAPVRSKKSATITSTRRLSTSPSKGKNLPEQSPVPSITSSVTQSPVKSDCTPQVSPFRKNASNRSRSSGSTGRRSALASDGKKAHSKSASNSPERSTDSSALISSTGMLVGTSGSKKIGKKYHIRLLKRANGLGFSITTRDNPAGTGVPPIYIKNILPKGSAIFDGRLKQGDRLLEVNGTEITGKSQEDTVEFLKSIPVGKFVDLIVSRQEPLYSLDPLPSPSVPRKIPPEKAVDDDSHSEKPREVLTFEIPLNDTGSAGLGVSVKGRRESNPDDFNGGMTDCGIFVNSVITGGAASKDGRLKPNDQLISINEISLLGMTNSDAMETLRKVMMSLPDGPDSNPGVIILTIARRVDASFMLNQSKYSPSRCMSGTAIETASGNEDAAGAYFDGGEDEGIICYSASRESQQQQEQEEHYLTTSGAAMTGPLTQIPSYILEATGEVASSAPLAALSSASPAASSTSALHPIASSTGTTTNVSPLDRLTSVDSTSRSDLERESESSFKPDESCSNLAVDPFTRDGFGRQSMSEKRHAHLNAKNTETYKRNKKAREERDDQSLTKGTPGRSSDRSHTRSAQIEHHRTASGSSYQHHRSSLGSSRIRSKSAHAPGEHRKSPSKNLVSTPASAIEKDIESTVTSDIFTPETGARSKTSTKGGIFSPAVCCWTGSCQSPGSCPYHPVKEKKSHQHATCLDSDQPLQSSSLANTGTTGLTGMRKSSSLENLDCLMQDLQKLQLASAAQSDAPTNTGQTTATNRLTGANHFSNTGHRAATLRVSRGSRVKNESFRAAVDRSYDAAIGATGDLTMHPQMPHQLGLFHHQAVTDPSNMETVAEESSENDGSYLGTGGKVTAAALAERNNVRLVSHSRPHHSQSGMGVGLGFHSHGPSAAAISMNSAATGFSNMTAGTATTATTATTTSSAEDDLVLLVKTGSSSKKERKGGLFNKFFKFGSRKCKTPPATSSHLPTVEQIIKELEKDAEKIRAKRQAQHEQERIQEALIRLKEQHQQQQQHQQHQQQVAAATTHGSSIGARHKQIHPVPSLQPEVMSHQPSTVRGEAIYSGASSKQQQLYSTANQQQHLHHAHRMAQTHQLYQQQATSPPAGDPIYQSRAVLGPQMLSTSGPMYQSQAHVVQPLPASSSSALMYQQAHQQPSQLFGHQQAMYQQARQGQPAMHPAVAVSDDYGHYMNYQQIQESRRSMYPVRASTTSTLQPSHPQAAHLTSLSSRPLPSHPATGAVSHQLVHHLQHPPPLPPGRPLPHPSATHVISQGQPSARVASASSAHPNQMLLRQQPLYQSSNVYIYQRPATQAVHAPTQTGALYSSTPATRIPQAATVLTQSHSQPSVPPGHYYQAHHSIMQPHSSSHLHPHHLPEHITQHTSSAYIAAGQPIYGSAPVSGYTSSPML